MTFGLVLFSIKSVWSNGCATLLHIPLSALSRLHLSIHMYVDIDMNACLQHYIVCLPFICIRLRM